MDRDFIFYFYFVDFNVIYIKFIDYMCNVY